MAQAIAPYVPQFQGINLIQAHSRQEVVAELAYVTQMKTLVQSHVKPEGFNSWVSYINRLGRMCRLSYDPNEDM